MTDNKFPPDYNIWQVDEDEDDSIMETARTVKQLCNLWDALQVIKRLPKEVDNKGDTE